MTFVPEPFEQFTEDLLTSLTGGVAREEHRFATEEARYALALPGILAPSVRVCGRAQDAFATFERGVDFDVDETGGALQWRESGRRPDDRTFFYVNYMPREATRRLTDRNPGSVTATLAGAIARELAVLHRQMDLIYRSAFVDLAEGTALDHVGALLAVERRGARFATGDVLMKRGTPAPGDITVPAGTLVSTAQGVSFEATDVRTLRRGQLSVVVPVRATVEGPSGQVKAGEVTVLNRPIFGIDAVVNEAATFFASAKESDEALRRRIRGTLERAGKSTLEAIRLGLIERVPGLDDTNVQVRESGDPGVVEVKIGLAGEPTPELVQRVEAAIFASRPAGVRVRHNLPTAAAVAVGVGPGGAVMPGEPASRANRAHSFPDAILQANPDGVLQLQAQVMIRLADPNVSAAQREAVESDVADRIAAFVEALPMGGDVVFAKLLARVAEPTAIADAILYLGAAVDAALFQENLATDGRKARIERRAIDVRSMDEPVAIDLRIEVEPAAGASAAAPGADLQAQLRKAIEPVLQAARTTVERAALRDVASAALAAVRPPLQLHGAAAVTLNAEYGDSGRVLNNVASVPLEKNHVARLRALAVEMQGALDG